MTRGTRLQSHIHIANIATGAKVEGMPGRHGITSLVCNRGCVQLCSSNIVIFVGYFHHHEGACWHWRAMFWDPGGGGG